MPEDVKPVRRAAKVNIATPSPSDLERLIAERLYRPLTLEEKDLGMHNVSLPFNSHHMRVKTDIDNAASPTYPSVALTQTFVDPHKLRFPDPKDSELYSALLKMGK